MLEPINTYPNLNERLIGLALDGLLSPHTRRAYRAALDELLTWSQGQQPSTLSKALVNRYKAMLIDKEPYDDRKIDVNGSARRLYMGGVLGGSTALYGAALMRPSRDDFHPGKSYGDRLPRPQWDWPISYEDLEPYYSEAERLYTVSGCNNDDSARCPFRSFDRHAVEVLSLSL